MINVGKNVSKQVSELTQITVVAKPPSGGDDTSYLQGLINGLQVGDSLLLMNGTYKATSLSITKSGVNIVGKNSTIQCTSSTYPFIAVSGADTELNNITIDGNNKAIIGVQIVSGSSNVRILNCTIQNCYNDGTVNMYVAGLEIRDNTNQIIVENCTFNNMIATANATVGDNIGTSRAILVNNSTSTVLAKNVFIRDCVINNVQPVEDGDGIQVTKSTSATDIGRVIIEKCKFTNCAKRAIKTNAPGTVIRDNEIINTSASTQSNWSDCMTAAISVYGSNIDVINNYIHGNSFYHAIDLDNGSSSSVIDQVKIINNKISIMENSTVTTNLGTITIYAKATNVLIQGNHVINGLHSLYVRGYADTITVIGNIFNGASSVGVRFDSFNAVKMANITISNNIINSANNGISVEYGTASVVGNVVNAVNGFGAFGFTNTTNVRKSANIGDGTFGVSVDVANALPALRSTSFDYGQEGAMQVLSVAGQLDRLFICLKDATDHYVWVNMPLGLSGATAARPANGVFVGMPFFDTTLNKPIWCKTTSPVAWVDATGAVV